jgi:hypothetical protein
MEEDIAAILPGLHEAAGSNTPVKVEWTGTMKVVVQYHDGDLFRPVAFHVEARDHNGRSRAWRIHNANPYLANPRDPRLRREVDEVAAGVAGDAGVG